MERIRDGFQTSCNRILDGVDIIRERFLRRIFPLKTLATFESRRSVGRAIRDTIAGLETLFGPVINLFLPNFIHFHYFYIITMGLVCSVLLYGPRNMKYIDCFFMGYASVSQAGLNTVNLNDITLYQQLVLYFMPMLTTPIFIHSILVFTRLYWFEREFDDIKRSSKLNHRMRRQATLAARTASMTSQDGGQDNTVSRIFSRFSRSNNEQDSSETESKESAIPLRSLGRIDASDMYRSIAMMREKNGDKNGGDDDYEDQGSALRVSGPAERERRARRKSDGSALRKAKNVILRRRGRRKGNRKPKGSGKDVLDEDLELSGAGDDNDFAVDSEDPEEGEDADDGDDDYEDNDDDEEEEEEEEDNDEEVNDPDDEESILTANVGTEDDHVSSNGNGGKTIPGLSRNVFSARDSSQNGLKTYPHNDSKTASQSPQDQVKSATPQLSRSQSNSSSTRSSLASNGLPHSSEILPSQALSRAPTSQLLHSHTPKNLTFQDPVRPLLPPKKLSLKSKLLVPKLRSLSRSSSIKLEHLASAESLASKKLYLSFQATFGRNSTFVPSNQLEKEELGGVEYRSLKLLAKILIWYYVGFQVLALMVYGFWIITAPHYKAIIRQDGISPGWWAAFTGGTVFNDLGFSLTPDSFMSFAHLRYVLLWGSFFIMIGNVGFPIMLRFLIWVMYKLSRDLSLLKELLGFLLDHPRRCFTLLFPLIPTWWLFFVLVILNAIDLILFCILDLHDEDLLYLLNLTKVLAAFFQAVSTRTAGTTVIDLSRLHPAIQVSYMLMMYVSALPLAISIRRTNVYEEQSLGIYAKGDDNEQEAETQQEAMDKKANKTNLTTRYIGSHLRRQLSFDLWYIFLGLFIICIAESKKLRSLDDPYFTIFQVLFEVVSAYGCVGLSLGYPNDLRSFSAQFNVVSKLVIVAMFIRGRHRGLPYAIDRAIILHLKAMEKRDQYQANHVRRALAVGVLGNSESSPNLERWNPNYSRSQEERMQGLDAALHHNPEIAVTGASDEERHEGVDDHTVMNATSDSRSRPEVMRSNTFTLSSGSVNEYRPSSVRRNTITFDTDTSFNSHLKNYQRR